MVRRHLDPVELFVFVVFAGISVWVLVLDLHYGTGARSWTGTDGVLPDDQQQYLAWIRDASHHLLVSNLFVTHATSHDYLQPLVAISGALTAIGLTPSLALLLWKPVAVVAVFLAVRAYIHASLSPISHRRAALILALFFVGLGRLFGHTDLQWFGITEDSWVGYFTWGYSFGVIGLAAMIGALVIYARAREAGRTVWVIGVFGALASWLHPWQGETLLALLAGTELVMWLEHRARPPWRLLLPALALTATPLLYYLALNHWDSAWRAAAKSTTGTWSLGVMLLTFAPLLVPGLLAYARRPTTFLGTATRLWPVVSIAIVLLSGLLKTGGFALHALLGIATPLAVLAVEGVVGLRLPRVSRPLVAGLVVAAFTIPAVVDQMRWARSIQAASVTAPVALNGESGSFITPDERRALDYLKHAPSGSVLARQYLGILVPAVTGRRTYVGHLSWSPGGLYREVAVRNLFFGTESPSSARDFVRSTSARFVLTDCAVHRDLAAVIAATNVRRFGCATVYEIWPVSPASRDPRAAG